VSILILVMSVLVGGQEQPPPGLAGGTSLVERFLLRDDPPLRGYRARRRLEARNDRFKAAGWIEVTTEFAPELGLTWTVTDEGGSTYIRRNVLLKALGAEATAVRAGDPAKAAITDANYNFFASEDQDDDTASIRIEPRRRDMLLVSGLIVLTRRDGDLVQIEGRLSKSPSFWTRTVDVIRRYDRKNGIRVPVSLKSTANVRIAGQSEFLMTYVYETINGESVKPEGH
jgi:hypothetical protein